MIHSDKDRFTALFASYYGLSRWGLTTSFKELFFKALFENAETPRKDASSILEKLSTVPRRRNGGSALEYSFVSKLISISDESSPIYDGHVASFFGKNVQLLIGQKKKESGGSHLF